MPCHSCRAAAGGHRAVSRLIVILGGLLLSAAPVWAQSAVSYHVTFPEPEHHWLQVEATFSDLGRAPFDARMSRSSPGRYAVHEFAKNVFSVEAYNGVGKPLTVTRPLADEWEVTGHDGTVRLVYKLFGDLVDGTYLAVDESHAHLNMPATFMFGVGLEHRPIRVTFSLPPGLGWKVATQLYATSDPETFTAPNLQYFMDSPTECSHFVRSTFSLPNPDGRPVEFRVVVHADASQADVDALARLVRRLVQEEEAVYGEFPAYEPGAYTFLLDYLPYDDNDGMEHRNSTFITAPDISLRTPQGRAQALESIAHEFFHNWNVERIRPVGLEPFDFTRENVTCCLWLAEGFTQYYGELLLARAGDWPATQAAEELARYAIATINGSGRRVRSAVEMSEYAPFADAATSIDPTDGSRTFISYYYYGAAVALALDLSLRETSHGALTLDDYMRRLWMSFGRPGGPAPGLVGRPYSLGDLQDQLALLTGDRGFATAFFAKYIEGRDVPDYARLLGLAGFALRPAASDRAWAGNLSLSETGDGLLIGSQTPGAANIGLVPFGTPAYAAGLDAGDTILSIAGRPATLAAWRALAERKPGDTVALSVRPVGGDTSTRTLTLAADPALQVVDLGGSMTPAERAFRGAWLGTKVK